MRRTIIAAWCILFSLGMYAQKALIIHKKDGTKLEVPAQAFEKFHFTGKAIVNDGDYTHIARYVVYSPATTSETLDIAFYVLNQSGMEFTEQGVCYSTTPGDVSNKITYADAYIKHNGNVTNNNKIYGTDTLYTEIAGLEFETTYYCRSYVNYQGTYYYSQEYSIHTGHPKMSWHGATVDPALYAETGFAMPSEEAWNTLTATSPYINHRPAFLLDEWNRYATPDRIEALKSQCSTTLECSDGTLYLLDTVDEEFVARIIDMCNDEIILQGCEAEFSQCNGPDTITCDASWGVPGDTYWQYNASTLTGNPVLTYTTATPLLANYKYKVEIIMAPETVDEEKLPNKYLLQFTNSRSTTLAKDVGENATQCAIYTVDITTTQFVESKVVIKSRVGSREEGYDRNIRVAQIKLTPIEPANN